MESIIKQNLEVLSIQDNITKFLCEKFQDFFRICCHDFKDIIIEKYCTFRLKMLPVLIRNNRFNFASKNMAIHLNIK